MMEDFYYEENEHKHVFLKCMLFIFIVGIIIGVYFYMRKENTIRLKNINIEVGSKLSNDVNDYLLSGKKYSSEYKLYLDNVDVDTIGKYSYKVKYNKHTKTGYINVLDTTKPVVVFEDDIVVGTEEEINPNLFIKSCEDYSLPCTVTLKNDKDYEKLKSPGTYNISLKVSDGAGNYVVRDVTIVSSDTESMSSKMSSDLNYYTNSEKDDTIEHVFFVKLDKAIDEDTLEYEGLVQETSATDFGKYVDGKIKDTKLITAYNKYGYVIGIQVEITFEDGTKRLIENKGEANEEKTEESEN